MKGFKKIAAFVLTVLILVGSVAVPSNEVTVNAAGEQYKQKLRNMGFPESYVTRLAELHYLHPNWTFTPLIVSDTYSVSGGTYDWEYIISGQNAKFGSSYRNLIYAGSSYAAYRDPVITSTYDSGWYKVSETGLRYFMDPRNFINENDIFMFESLSWTDSFTVENVADVLSGTFMDGKTCDNGLSYAQTIYDAAKASNINPMFLASRLKQENSTGTSQLVKGNSGSTLYKWYSERTETSAAGKPVWGGSYDNSTFTYNQLVSLDGYYNLFNIGAGGNGVFAIIYNGATHAKNSGWSSHAASIYGGAAALATNYINKYQDTIYLQKFNIDGNSPYGPFAHQYMQNVAAPLTEGRSTRKAYYEGGFIDYAHNFEIPVYANMPSTVSADPAGGSNSYAVRPNSTKAVDPAEMVFDSQTMTTWLASGAKTSNVTVEHLEPNTLNNYDSFARITTPSSSTSDPYITFDFSSCSKISANSYKYLTIVARTSTSGTTMLMPYAGSLTSPSTSCAVSTKFTSDGLWHEYVIDLSSLSNYTGSLHGLRLTLFTGSVKNAVLDIRSVRFSTTKPATVSLTSNSSAYNQGDSVILTYSGLATHVNTKEDYRPFIAIYDANGGPGRTSAIQWAYIDGSQNSSLTFPAAAQGGTNTGTLPDGDYVAYVAFDSYGVMNEYNLSNAIYSGISSVYFTVGESKNPTGRVEEVHSGSRAIRVSGWAFDPDSTSQSIEIHAYIGGPAGSNSAEAFSFVADGTRSDVNQVYGISGNHGFEFTFVTSLVGDQPLYIYAINVGNGTNTMLSSQMVTIPESTNPTSALENVVGKEGAINIGGWAFDMDDYTQSLEIHVYIGGAAGTSGAEIHAVDADYPRSDVNSAYNITGNHGFEANIRTDKRGVQEVYVYAINIYGGENLLIGSATVTIAEGFNNVIKVDTGAVSGSDAVFMSQNVTSEDLASELEIKLNASSVTIKTASGATVSNTTIVGTGMVAVANGVSYAIVIQGDVDGNGSVNVADATAVLQYIRGQASLSGAYLDAALLDESTDEINILDVAALLNMI